MPESAPISMDGDPARDSLTGTIAGRFEIENRVGTGGMGEVYRAQDTRLKCAVALKRLSPALRNDALYRRRLMEEAQRAVRLRNDPRVAAVYDVLETKDEIFLIMEFVEGETLRQRLARPIQLQEFLHIASQCAEALVAANDRGIIHGDIKPENIMLTPAGQVKILDFGVAKQMVRTGSGSGNDTDETIDRAGTFAGTPAYMAPEILLHKPHPFRADSFSITSDRIRGEKPAPAHSYNSDVSPALDSLLQRMLAKKPADRYPDARELLADLDHLQSGLTPARLQRLLPQQQRKASVRKGFVLGAVAVLVAVLSGWGIYASTHRTPVLKERGWVLVSDFESTGDDPIPGKSVNEMLRTALEQSRYVNVYPRSRIYEVLKLMKHADGVPVDEAIGSEICQRRNLQVLLAGSVQHFGEVFQITVRGIDPAQGTLLFAERQQFRRKEDVFDTVDTISRSIRKDLGESAVLIQNTSKRLADVTTSSLPALQRYSQAKDLVDQGKQDQVETLLKGAIQQDPKFAMAHLELAMFYGSGVGKNDAALESLQRAYDLREEVTDREQLRIKANYFAAHELYEEQVQSLALLVGAYPDDAEAHEELAGGYYNSGQLEKAITELKVAARLNPLSVSSVQTLLVYLTVANHSQEAVSAYEQARKQGIDSPEMRWGLGLAYLALGRIDDARNEFRLLESEQGMWVGLGQHYLAKVEMCLGRIGLAERELDASIASDQAADRKGFQLKARFLKGRLLLLVHSKRLARQQAVLILRAPDADLQGSDLQNAGILLARSGAITESRNVLHRLNVVQAKASSKWNKSCMLNLRGEIALAERRADDAVTDFTEAVIQSPQVNSHVGLARAYSAQGNLNGAIAEWKKVLDSRGEILHVEFPPDFAFALLYLARAYHEVGDDKLSQGYYQEFLSAWDKSDQGPLMSKIRLEATGRSVTFDLENP